MSFEEYYRDIEVSETIQRRIDQIIEIAKKLLPITEDVKTIFITNHPSKDIRTFQNLWIFTESFVFESKNFISSESKIKIDITYYPDTISKIEIVSSDFDLINEVSTVNSWMHVEGDLDDVYFDMTAKGKNCEYLWKIIIDYLRVNLFYLEDEDEE